MARQRLTTRFRPVTSIAAGFLTLFALTLALASRAEAYVYWVELRELGTIETPTVIGRSNMDGSGKQDLLVLPRADDADGLAVGDAHLYWTDSETPEVGQIGRASLDGSGANQRFIADVDMSSYGRGVAVDEEHIYWVSKFGDDSGFKPNSGAIGRANLDGTGVDESFITGLQYPAGALAVDSAHLYWSRYPDHPGFGLYIDPGAIGRANLDGTQVEESFVGAPAVISVAVDDTHIWWASRGRFGGGIERANLDGTGGEQLIGGEEDFFPCGIAVDDTHVYWRDGYLRTVPIGRARLDGTRALTGFIADTGVYCGGLAVDGLGPSPSNAFSFGKVSKNKKRGSAKLTVKVPGPGELDLAKTKKVKPDEELVEAAGKEKLSIKPKGRAKKKLNTKGKAKVKAKVTYTPDGGSPNTEDKKIKLVKR